MVLSCCHKNKSFSPLFSTFCLWSRFSVRRTSSERNFHWDMINKQFLISLEGVTQQEPVERENLFIIRLALAFFFALKKAHGWRTTDQGFQFP
jgi:hypothetical protein